MKKFIPYIACGLLLISGWACTRTDDLDVVGVEQGKIVIRTALDPQVETRVVADESAERKITRIDVVVVDPATGNIEYREVHEKADGLNNFSEDNGNGTLTLKKERNTFTANKAYNIYLIANASAAIATKLENTTATTTLDDLKRLVQEDYTSTTANGATTFSTLLHLSGTTTPQATAPQTFLMDAVVTQEKGSEVRDIILYDGVQTNNTSVYAEFKRAAAKVIINIKQGSSVEFMRTLSLTAADNNGVATMGDAQYEFYNLPTETKVLAEGYDLGRDNNTLIETKLITIPESGSYPTFVWKDDVGSVAADGTGDVKVQIVGYADAHEWANASTLNYEPSLLLNLPIMWDANKDADKDDGDGKETARGGNWYKVPLSQNKVFERNTCYIVNITINAVGAESKSEAIELDDIDYDTRPWDVTTIKIGGDSERPKYLKLNTDLVTMYNTNIDTEQLVFSSSSPITSIVLADVYTQNADGTFTKVETGEDDNMASGDGFYAYYLNKYSNNKELTASMFEVSNLSDAVKATAPSGELSGNITIISPLGPNEAELNAAIAKLNKPVHPGEPPVAPEGFVETLQDAPNPEDFVPGISETAGDWVGEWYETQTRTVNLIRYRYENGMFQYDEGTRTDTREYNFGAGYEITTGTPNWNNDWKTDEETTAAYEARYDEYEKLKKMYEASINNSEHNAYRIKLAEYRALLDTYNSDMETYNADVAKLKQTMSDIPETHYNTVRYLEFLVTNEEGLTETFRVEQYPTIYIQNIVGWYSYRDDFYVHDDEPDSPTSYKYKGDRIVGISYNSSNQTYTYNTSYEGFWRSKVNRLADGSLHSTLEKFDIDNYYWGENSTQVSTANISNETSHNARMYHINVTTTSAKHTVGRPLIVDANGNPTDDVENGVTDPSVANSKLVSPSFMTASRLGFLNTSGNITLGNNAASLAVVREHCKNYVEVAADGTEYHNWRLPTAAEIQLIIDLQSEGSSDTTVAIDYLLNAANYFSASGPVGNSKGTVSGTSVRCVRDAYNDPKEN
ncbi:MAG: hypothetical protein IJA24_08800 [Alistipes sp.]|nr:hypothetical protein [Alistipes sp.]